MNTVERHITYPDSYGTTFADVFEHYEADGLSEFEWGYGKTDRYKVTCSRDEDKTDITLQSIRYDGDWQPIYTPVYYVRESEEGAVHAVEESLLGQVPSEAVTVPELVLRSILHNVQVSVRLRQKNGLI